MTAAEKLLGPAATNTSRQRHARAYTAGIRAASFVRAQVNTLLTAHAGHVLEQRPLTQDVPFELRCVTCDADIRIVIKAGE